MKPIYKTNPVLSAGIVSEIADQYEEQVRIKELEQLNNTT